MISDYSNKFVGSKKWGLDNKIRSLFICIAVLVSLCGMSAFATDQETVFDVTGGTISDGKVTVTVNISGIPQSDGEKVSMLDFILDFGDLSDYIHYPTVKYENYNRTFERGISLTGFSEYSLDGMGTSPPTGLFFNHISDSTGIVKLDFTIDGNAPLGDHLITVKATGDGSWLNDGNEDTPWFVAYNYDEDEDVAEGFVYNPTIKTGVITVGSTGSDSVELEVGEGKSITNNTAGSATVTGTVTDGTATLNVASEKACVVAYTTDDGATYNRLTAKANSEGSYDFDVQDYSEEMKFVVALKGDSNGDGNVNTADSMTIARSCLSNTHSAYLERSAINDCLYDINGDNQVNTADSMLIARACLSTTHAAYQALTW